MIDPSFWKDKKVFVTGHTGFKGAWLTAVLNTLGAEVFGYALDAPTSPSLFEEAGMSALTMSDTRSDIRNLAALTQALRASQAEIVLHLAAQSLVQASYVLPVDTYEINVIGTVNLLEAVRQVDTVRSVIVVTTDKCYEDQHWCWGYRESDRLGGFDPYSNSKACAELVTSSYINSFFNPKHYNNHGVAVASVRAGNVVGGGDWASNRLIPDCISALRAGRSILLRNPLAVRPWQHVLEPLGGYLLLAEKLYTAGVVYTGAFNFGPEETELHTVETVTRLLCRYWGEGASYEEAGLKLEGHETATLRLDSAKAHQQLGWRPLWDIETTLLKVVEWNKAYMQAPADCLQATQQQITAYVTAHNERGNKSLSGLLADSTIPS